MVEIPGAEFVPEMPENALGFGKVPDAGCDPPFKPVEAKLGPFVRELLVDATGAIENDQGFLRLSI